MSGTLTYTPDTITIQSGSGDTRSATVSGITPGTGTLIYSITSTDVPGISIDSSTGEITVADSTSVGNYTVDVSVESDITGSVAIPGRVSVMVSAASVGISGALRYDNISLAGDYSEVQTVSLSDSSTYDRGTGTPTMAVTYTTTGGATGLNLIADADGVVTIPAGLTGSGPSGTTYRVNSNSNG